MLARFGQLGTLENPHTYLGPCPCPYLHPILPIQMEDCGLSACQCRLSDSQSIITRFGCRCRSCCLGEQIKTCYRSKKISRTNKIYGYGYGYGLSSGASPPLPCADFFVVRSWLAAKSWLKLSSFTCSPIKMLHASSGK